MHLLWIVCVVVASGRPGTTYQALAEDDIDYDTEWQAQSRLLIDNDGLVHPALRFTLIHGGRGIVVADHVPKDEVIMRVPSKLMLSRKHLNGSVPSIAYGPNNAVPEVVKAIEHLGLHTEEEDQPGDWGTTPETAFAVWLAIEMHKETSPYGPYVHLLRRTQGVGHACEIRPQLVDQVDDEELMRILEEHMPQMPPYRSTTILDNYKQIVAEVDPTLIKDLTLKSYMQAFFSIITRTFNVGGVRALTPLFEFVNHAHNMSAYYTQEPDGAFLIRSAHDLHPGDEVTIEYTSSANAALYEVYGFTLPTEVEHGSSWTWNKELVKAYGGDYEHAESLGPPNSDSFNELVSYGLSPMSILKDVIQPKLQQIEAQSDENVAQTHSLTTCDLNRERIKISGMKTAKLWKPIVESVAQLESLLGPAFVDAVLAEGGEVTREYFHAVAQGSSASADEIIETQMEL